ncbi:preprotein translocase subunit SecA [Candidatus Nitrosacidococcus tergens]|uniref:Protein translocase subunit SecA n=1 Tax=Candidatus Nitrosacidococcus tergens TaxID=553981 RepID=A0A7G1QB45_9GAMM|nr:preprotein translocase subunit SecA [Candidatus Nitrosacidococcus tergens]CAB1276915.1 preprotein translocase subunit, ATPase [Candidatus Nitrosacidococcus tergens]
MVIKFLNKVFGSRNDRLLRNLNKIVDQVNTFEPSISNLSDEQLQEKTKEFRNRLAQGEDLDNLVPEVFAVVRESGKRVLGMRHFDAQLIGAMVLNDGKIAEMRTGEGKTLVATLAAYLNALPGKGVHVVTVNDYLAQRDSKWMGSLYQFLGLSTGVILSNMEPAERKAAYNADITYGTNNEFGFDYLRDNMAFSLEEKVQRELHYAIVDEVDSILIDEARTPLIISGAAQQSSELYQRINKVIPQLNKQEEEEGPGDYTVDEKARQVYLTDAGHEKVEQIIHQLGLMQEGENLYDAANISLMHHISSALCAHVLFHKDVDYIVKDDQVIIVDEFTGRTMPGRRWSEGLHQAVEAKEGVSIQSENQTLASITFQNYFRLYEKLSGMTGTADTEAYEFQQIYDLEVVVIPTHLPMIRKDHGDKVYLTAQEKFQAIAEDVKECCHRNQPVLVGTASIETSELLSKLLTKENIQHQVLNAKFHEKEAHIIAQAGKAGTVTIATNMAGRGTDIVLGGSLETDLATLGEDASEEQKTQVKQAWQERQAQVKANGGLHIIGTERHESRRIDNQLRGRSGRQGDPGSSRFYLSLEDSLMRIFASDKISGLMNKLGMEKGEAIEHPWVTKAIENAQRKVEGHNFDIRKQLLEFDDVANDQRKVIYEQRNDLMRASDISETITDIRHDVIDTAISQHIPPGSLDEQWDVHGLQEELASEFNLHLNLTEWLHADESLHEETLREHIIEAVDVAYKAKEESVGAEIMRHFEKAAMLQVLDYQWKEHLATMDHLRQGIHLRGYAQQNPKQEFKREAFELFQGMLGHIKHDVVTLLAKVQIQTEADVEAVEHQRRNQATMQYQHESANAMIESEQPQIDSKNLDDAHETNKTPYIREGRKVGRNEICPCGSGKKFKHCHGKLN